MISLIRGQVLANFNGELTILTAGGVGYKIWASPQAIEKSHLNSEVTLATHLVVREDVLELFGFGSEEEGALFRHFISVSGVGPKTALNLLSLGEADDITNAIMNGDEDFLTKVSGIGKKTAARLILELKSKLSLSPRQPGPNMVESKPEKSLTRDVFDALTTLGYSENSIRSALKQIKTDGKTSEQVLRETLKIIQ